jgi:hypothetical protein
MFSWRKNTIIKYSSGYVGERFAGFLEIQIYAPWPSYCNNIFVLHLLMATMVIPSPLFATTIKKFMKTFATQKRTFATQERKRKKGGPSLHVYILGYHVCLT